MCEEEAAPQARVQESGRFRLVHDETLQSRVQREREHTCLQNLPSANLWLIFACMTLKSCELLEPLLNYQHQQTEADSKPAEARGRYAGLVGEREPSDIQISDYVAGSLPSITDTIISLDVEEVEKQNTSYAMRYDEESEKYAGYLELLQILLKYVRMEKESVLVILKKSCMCV